MSDCKCDGCYEGSHECYECGGDGYIESDDWQDFGALVKCPICFGRGAWPCPAAEGR